jgi:hypothetical protein
LAGNTLQDGIIGSVYRWRNRFGGNPTSTD